MRYIIMLLLGLATMQAFQLKESVTITGTITDTEGNPVEGASIIVKGTKMGTVTDQSGFFTITIPDEKSIIVIRCVGYESREIKPGTKRKSVDHIENIGTTP